MDILKNQKKILQNQERLLEQMSLKVARNNPWKPHTQDTDGVMWTTDEVSRESRMQEQRCKTGCAASLAGEGVTDLSMFYDKCVLDGGDVLLGTTSEVSMTTGAEALVGEYAKSLERGERPTVRCSISVTDDNSCDVWNAGISTCMTPSKQK